MVKILALVDPQTARDVLQAMEPWIDTISSARIREHWLTAWALADPSQVPQRAQEEMARARNTPDWGRCIEAVLRATDVLTVPPSERPKYLTRQRGGLWAPGEEM